MPADDQAPSALPTITIAIASHQRRQLLQRLLLGLAEELAPTPDLQRGLDVVVVLDGSTDGSRELLATLRYPVPLRTIWQPNRGLAAARNTGLAAATGELVWFLDDDLTPGPGLIARHRRLVRPTDRRIVVGPCMLPDDVEVHPLVRKFWVARYAELAAAGVVERFDRFSAANTSGPVADFRAVGGFDERFVGYGGEDYELAIRLLAAGHEIAFDSTAVAWHLPPHTAVRIVRRWGEEGRNLVRVVAKHPETFEPLFPVRRPRRRERLVFALRLHRHPLLLEALSDLLLPFVVLEERITRRRRWRLLDLAGTARFIANVARHDPDGRLTARVLALPHGQP